jgi:hypothetical protein
MRTRPVLDMFRVVQNPMTAPLLPARTAVQAHELSIQFTKAINIYPEHAEAMVEYICRYPTPVQTYLIACLRNLTQAVTPAAAQDVSLAPAFRALSVPHAAAIRGSLMLRARMSTPALERHVARGTIGLAELVDRFHRLQHGHGRAVRH